MKQYNIVRAVVSADPGERLDEWLEFAPERFVGGPSCGKVEQLLPLTELKRAFLDKKYGILGELGLQYSGISPDDEVLEPYFALAEQLDIPVLIHAAGIGARTPGFSSRAGLPLFLEEVLKRHPRLSIYVENAGYPFGDQMIALMYQYPQVYADLSTISWIIPRTAFHDYMERLVRAGFSDRLMFGSDQMIWPETIGMAVEAIESANFLTKAQKRDIFFNNAVRFFRWDRQELEQLSWTKAENSTDSFLEADAAVLRRGNPSDVGMSEEVLNNAAGLFQRAVDDGDISGAVLLVARRGTIVLHRAIGWRDVENQIPMTLDTLFNIASITKSIVSTGALILAENGKLDLEAPVANYIPEFAKGRSSEIRVKHLMNHTSGLRFTSFGGMVNAEELSHFPDLQTAVSKYPEVGPVTAPGDSYYYSNRGYCTLSAVIERVSGGKLDSFIDAVIFQPLGMENSFFPEWHFESERLATPYVMTNGRLTREESAFLPYPVGYGFAISTAAELAKFGQLYLNRGHSGTKRILSENSVREATRASIQTPYLYIPPEGHRLVGRDPVPRWYYMRDSRGLGIVNGYGYGWSTSTDGSFEHAGNAGTFIRVDPQRELIVIMMTRCANARIPGNEFLGFVENAVIDELN